MSDTTDRADDEGFVWVNTPGWRTDAEMRWDVRPHPIAWISLSSGSFGGNILQSEMRVQELCCLLDVAREIRCDLIRHNFTVKED